MVFSVLAAESRVVRYQGPSAAVLVGQIQRFPVEIGMDCVGLDSPPLSTCSNKARAVGPTDQQKHSADTCYAALLCDELATGEAKHARRTTQTGRPADGDLDLAWRNPLQE
jgi:hypothetical protein